MNQLGGGFRPKPAGARLPAKSVACKCQICVCGKHQCPPDRHLFEISHYDADSLQTLYNQTYKQHPIPKRDNNKPQPQIVTGGKFEGVTTCQSDFQPHHVPPAKLLRPPHSDSSLINGGNNSRDYTSENRAQYSPKRGERASSFAPREHHASSLPFEGQSVTSSDFRAHPGAKPSTPFREQSSIGATKEDRDFQSEAALKFTNHGVQQRQTFKPEQQIRNNAPFEGTTTNRNDFKGLFAPPSQSCAPAYSSTRQPDDRDFQSQNALSYVPKGVHVRESFKPKYETGGGGKFDAVTTNRQDFPAWKAGPSASCRPRNALTDTTGVLIGSPDSRDWNTEHRAQHNAKGVVPTQSFAPREHHASSLPFEGQSVTSSDFRAHPGAKPSTPFREQSSIGATKEDRDFQSEAALKFTNHGVQQRQTFKPEQQIRNNAPFEGQSVTKSDYRAWSRSDCPARALPDEAPRNKEGHLVFTNYSGQWRPAQV